MLDQYDEITASHYTAYRPSLHVAILKKCVESDHTFPLGLDIGCGAGHSTIALSKHCKRTIGVDPSKSMIKNAIEHQNIEYQYFDGSILDFESNIFDVGAFAGSLHYAKSQILLDEVTRVLKNDGLILVYDFEILLADILNELGFKSDGKETYDHEADFSGLDGNAISLLKERKETVRLEISTPDLAHLLLSVTEQYRFFQKESKKNSVYPELSKRLDRLSDLNILSISANLFYKVYSVSKSASK